MASPFFLIAVLAFLAGSCDPRSPRSASPATIQDDLGNLVPTGPPPQRIVSLAPNLTEILFALGLDSAVVGVTDFCNYPPEAAQKPKIGGLANPSYERIVALNPDLVLLTVAGNSRADYEKLRSLGLRLFVTNPSSVAGVHHSIAAVGTLTGRVRQADSILQTLRRQQDSLTTIAGQRARRSVLLLVSLKPLIAAGKGTFLHELIGMAHATNVAGDAAAAYPMMNREHLLSLDPDVIIATTDIAHTSAELANAYPEWKSLRAVRNGAVFVLDGDLLSRPGPRIMEALTNLVTTLQ